MSLSPFPSVPRPPGADAPAPCEVPQFAPVRVRGGRYQLRRLVRSRRRALALGLAVTAAALVAAGPGDAAGRARGHPAGDGHVRGPSSTGDPVRRRPTAEAVEAPVRIADAATVRLLRPGDRVDVIAAEQTAAGGDARVVARKALVTRVPEPLDGALGGLGASAPDGTADVTGEAGMAGGVEVAGGVDVAGEAGLPGAVDGGALVVLSVPPSTAARLAGASATARLAVTLW
ncbi:hypothetical protein ACFW2D_12100 [Streptomyces sp. NPDC058914]|uniref:hypothetical protein n=1 Tax=Streptomyces sp. NPDC058914 TaxID=3346671 RepID=UPI0036C8C954